MNRLESMIFRYFMVCGFAVNLIAAIILLSTFTPELERLCNP